MLGCQVVPARVVSRWAPEQQVLWSRLTSVDLRNEDKQLLSGVMDTWGWQRSLVEQPVLEKSLESGFVFSHRWCNCELLPEMGSGFPKPAPFLLLPSQQCQSLCGCRLNWVVCFLLNLCPKKKKRSFTLNQQLNLLSLWPQDCGIRLAGIWLGRRNKNDLFLVAACRCNEKEVWNKTFPDNSRNRSKKAGCPHGRRMGLKEASEENPSWIICLHIKKRKIFPDHPLVLHNLQ